jgi:hypothetical protein
MKPATEMVLLLGIAGLMLIGIEGATRTLILPKSKIETRTEAEFNTVTAIRSNSKNHTLILLGNSLLGKGVEMDTLGAMLPTGWKAKRLLVEDTSFYDWYYGMQHLFSSGSRPDAVILMLSIKQLTSNSIRGEYSAYRMMSFMDLPILATDLQMHPTAASGLLVGNLSAFYGTRVEVRKQVLGLLMPDFADLTRLLIRMKSAGDKEELPDEKLRKRFEKLKQLSKSQSIPIALLIAPEFGLRYETLLTASKVAAKISFDVLTPVKPGEMRQNDFSDGFHLNPNGAAKFTEALAETLRCYLASDLKVGSDH